MEFINQVEPWVTDEDRNALSAYMASGGWLTEHKHTREFEQQVADYVGARHASCVPNGTLGLYLALKSLDLGPGSFVGVPAYTMAATVNAVLMTGATPVFIDIDPTNGCMDLGRIRGVPVQALIYVEINGRSGDLQRLVDHCNSRGTFLIEDACQAFGSKHQGKHMGTWGDIGVYSLSPHKIITTGQGGILVTNRESVYKKICGLRDFGREEAGVDWHTSFGINCKFTDIQAVIGKSQLASMPKRIEKKLAIFEEYKKYLPKYFSLAPLADGNVPWFIDILCKDRDERDSLKLYLKGKWVGSREFYPPLIDQPYLAKLCAKDTPYARKYSGRGLWLPSSLTLTTEQLSYITNRIISFV